MRSARGRPLRVRSTPRAATRSQVIPEALGRPEAMMTVAPMTQAEVAEVSELLCSSYTLLQEREGLSREQTEFLKSERGSAESIERESQSQCYIVARDASQIVGVVCM